MLTSQEKPVWKIEAKSSYLNLNLHELLSYRHLLFRLVRKEFLVNYQQTLLGPVWILFQPLLTMLTYVFVFNKVIGVSVGGKLPPVLFYFSGIVLWNFFKVSFTPYLLAVPFVVVVVGMISLSLGLMFSVLTAKYRDLGNFVDISVRILLFITPVIYPLSAVKENIRWVVQLNPLAPLFELFRLGVLGEGIVSPWGLLNSCCFMIVTLLLAIMLFNKMG